MRKKQKKDALKEDGVSLLHLDKSECSSNTSRSANKFNVKEKRGVSAIDIEDYIRLILEKLSYELQENDTIDESNTILREITGLLKWIEPNDVLDSLTKSNESTKLLKTLHVVLCSSKEKFQSSVSCQRNYC